MKEHILLLVSDKSTSDTEINGKWYRRVALPPVNKFPYSINGIKMRKEMLGKMGYGLMGENKTPKGFSDFVTHLERGKPEEEMFSLWLNDCETKAEKAYVGTVNWLTENKLLAKSKKYPRDKREALGIEPYRKRTPVDFDFMLSVMKKHVAIPLKKSTFIVEKPYNPRKQDNNCFHYQTRKRAVKGIGPVIHFMGGKASQWVQCWFEGLGSARHIDPYSKKLSMNHKFLGGFFPIGYRDNTNGHPRLLYKNYNNISTIKGSWRVTGASLWEQNTGLHLYSVDIGSAHARFFYWAIGGVKGVNNTDGVLLDDNYWDRLTDQFLKIMQLEEKLPFKPIRRLFKIGSLALMNGGSLRSKKNLLPAIKNKLDLTGAPIQWAISLITTYFVNLKSSIEIKIASKTLENGGMAWPMGSTQRYVKTEKPHQVLSAIYCGPEVLAMTHLVQVSLLEGVNLLPVALEMDGILVASKDALTNQELTNLSRIYDLVLLTVIGIHLPVTIKSVV